MTRLNADINDPGDEESLGWEAFPLAAARFSNVGFFSQGEPSSSSERDIYQISVNQTSSNTRNTPAGTYAITLTSDRFIYGWDTHIELPNGFCKI